MSQISRELHIMLQASVREALSRRHHYVTVEHLLFAMIHDVRGAEILHHAGADVPALKAALERYFRDDLESIPGEDPYEAEQTLAFHRVLQNAVAHCESAEKDEVDAGDILAAIFQEPESHAVTLLRGQGVTRLDVLHYLSHGVSKARGEGVMVPAKCRPAWSRASASRARCRPIRSRPTPPTSPSGRTREGSTR